MKTDLRVLMSIQDIDLRSGGPSKSATSLAKALTDSGNQVALLAMDSGQELIVPRDQQQVYRLCLINWQGSFFERRRALREMTAHLRAGAQADGPVIIHNHGLWLGVNRLSARVAREENLPLVISTRGMLAPWALNYRKRKKQLAWRLYQKRDLASACLLHATAEKEALNLRQLGIKNPIAVIPNGVDIPSSKDALPESESIKTVLFLSRIHPVKGIKNLVEAWGQLRPEGWRVQIAGPDETGHLQEIEARIAELGLTGQFEVLGPIYDQRKQQLFSQADLFVLPSHSENFGFVVAEALASETPVITTTGTPWQDLHKHNCGWWVDVGAEPLAAALGEAMNLSDQQRQDMGKRGRKLIENSYSWAKIAADMTEAYRWVLEGGNPPACVMTD